MSYEKKCSLKSIAYELDLSVNTVSRALRDCSDISSATKQKVRKVALEMGYLPNSVLYNLDNNNTKLIGLVINNINNYYFSIMSNNITYYLKKAGYFGVIIPLFGNEFDMSIVKECIYQRVNGIISFVEPTQNSLELVKINKIPFLMLGRKIQDKYCNLIYTDDFHGGEIAAKYLLSKGCKNFFYINVNGSECSVRRFNGFKTYLKNNGNYKANKINIENFEKKYLQIVNSEKVGIFFYNDEHLFIVKSIFEKLGIDINKYKIIGYDAIAKGSKGIIKYPSIGFDYDEIARTAVDCIINADKRERKTIKYDVKLEI